VVESGGLMLVWYKYIILKELIKLINVITDVILTLISLSKTGTIAVQKVLQNVPE
jgi:hypothetical protein